jgi:hypothetical protein
MMKKLATLLPLFLLMGCSGAMRDYGKRLAVNHVSDAFDMDAAQREATRGAVDRLLEEAPALLGPPGEAIVEAAARAIQGGFPEEALLALELRIDALMDDAVAALLDEAAPILASLRDPQIDHFEQRSMERLKDARGALDLPADARLETRQDAYIEEVEKWTGRLTNAQEELLLARFSRTPDEAHAQLAAREAQLSEILLVLRGHPGPARVRDALWAVWTKREEWGPDARPYAQRRADGRETLRSIHEILTPRQVESMGDQLRSLHGKLKSFLGLE